MATKLNAQDLDVTNNSNCPVDISFSALDPGTCNISNVGPVTVNAGQTTTIPSPYPSGFVYKVQVQSGANTCAVGDCGCNTNGCTPPGSCSYPLSCSITSSSSCGSITLTSTFTPVCPGSNSSLVVN